MNGDINQRIELFNYVRDYPYSPLFAAEKEGRSYETKAEMLCGLLKDDFKLESRRILCRFHWNETPFPPKLIALAPIPDAPYDYLEVFVSGRYKRPVIVDPMWDSGLRNAGFPIAEWDGVHSTRLGVKPYKIYTPEESSRMINFLKQDIATDSDAERQLSEVFTNFHVALNTWLEKQRGNLKTPHV